MFYTCNTCVEYTPVLHIYFYICNTCVEYTPVLHMQHVYYKYVTYVL